MGTVAGFRRKATRLYLELRSRLGPRSEFPGSSAYWEKRYRDGGNSGRGSYGKFAEFKAEILNAFVRENGVESVIELGCGDGNQLLLAAYPRYMGFDVSESAVLSCRRLFSSDSTKSFAVLSSYAGESAELALSLDVIYHLVEDETFDAHMRTLFAAARRFVIIYSTDESGDQRSQPHVRHREFTRWTAQHVPDWELTTDVPDRYSPRSSFSNDAPAGFYVFRRA
jgi:hypothetical protein